MMNNAEQLKKLMENEKFVREIVAMEEPEDVQKAFAEKGFTFSIEEINQIARMAFAEDSDELSTDELETVAGGIGVVEGICIVAAGVKFLCDVGTEINNSRKAKGKKPIW